MKIHHFLLATLRSKTVKLSATLILATFGMGFLPIFFGKATARTSSSMTSPRLARQQRPSQWIEVDLSRQQVVAWNGGTPVKTFIASTGKSRTPTPTGTFAIQGKYSSTSMQGANYYVADVPYTMYFSGGYALHGAYWHNSFGVPVSHGCVNLRVRQARWLYSWAPVGTKVVVHQ